MRWSILIATLAHRKDSLAALLRVLLPQAERFPGQVEVVALRNRGALTVGEYRQKLLEDARGKYVSFVDDDDLVAGDFVTAVLAAMVGEPDYVAFRHQMYSGGVPEPRVTITGLSFGGWRDTDVAMVRDVTHINPVRAELARKAGFGRYVLGEDAAYDDALRPLLKTEAVIDRVLYHYYFLSVPSASMGIPAVLLRRGGRIPEVRSPVFRWHPESVTR